MRALACIPRTADTRLMLVKRTDGRPPGYDRENDYDVVFRGRKVGRIWKYDYTGKVSGEMARWLWHWDWRDVEGRKDAEGHCGSLAHAMPQFRAVWDAAGANVRNITGRPMRERVDASACWPIARRLATSVLFSVGVHHHDSHDGQHARPGHVLQPRLAQRRAL